MKNITPFTKIYFLFILLIISAQLEMNAQNKVALNVLIPKVQNQEIDIQLDALKQINLLTEMVDLNTECSIKKFNLILLEKKGSTPVEVLNNGNELSKTGLLIVRNALKGSIVFIEKIELSDECEDAMQIPHHVIISVK